VDSLVSDLEKAFKGKDTIKGVHTIVVKDGEDKKSAEERYQETHEIGPGDVIVYIDCVSNAGIPRIAPWRKEPLEDMEKAENFVLQDLSANKKSVEPVEEDVPVDYGARPKRLEHLSWQEIRILQQEDGLTEEEEKWLFNKNLPGQIMPRLKYRH
jgi:hypothetical protein